jgi:acyl dehydratase
LLLVPTLYYLEDLQIGEVHRSESLTVSEADMIEFARQYDPQPFHLEHKAAKESIFGELVASGWHTAALTMRLRCTSDFRLAGGWIGLGIDLLQWPNPVKPGDTLTAESEVLEARISKSRPTLGVIKVKTTVYNQHREEVMIVVSNQLVERKGEAL